MAYSRTIAAARLKEPINSLNRKEKAESESTGVRRESEYEKRQKVLHADGPLVAKSRTMRDRVAQWIAMKAAEPGITNIEVAKRLGITAHYLNTLIYLACRQGWLKFESPENRIEYELIPKAIQNMNDMLEEGDKTATIETLKGTAFPIYREQKGAGDNSQTVLALKIETVEPVEIKRITGNMVGKAKELPAAIVNKEPDEA